MERIVNPCMVFPNAADLLAEIFSLAGWKGMFLVLDNHAVNKYPEVRFSPMGLSFENEMMRYHRVGMGKIMELFITPNDEPVCFTPLVPPARYEEALGFMGGVKHYHTLAAITGLRQEHDRLMVLLGMYAMDPDPGKVQLHHFGIGTNQEEQFDWFVRHHENKQRLRFVEDNTSSSRRKFAMIPGSRALLEVYYNPEEDVPPGGQFHVDVSVSNPDELFAWLGQGQIFEPEIVENDGTNATHWMWAKAPAKTDKPETDLGIAIRPLINHSWQPARL